VPARAQLLVSSKRISVTRGLQTAARRNNVSPSGGQRVKLCDPEPTKYFGGQRPILLGPAIPLKFEENTSRISGGEVRERAYDTLGAMAENIWVVHYTSKLTAG